MPAQHRSPPPLALSLGYFLGALAAPALMRRVGTWRLLMTGAILASIFMLMSGLASGSAALFVQRVCVSAPHSRRGKRRWPFRGARRSRTRTRSNAGNIGDSGKLQLAQRRLPRIFSPSSVSSARG